MGGGQLGGGPTDQAKGHMALWGTVGRGWAVSLSHFTILTMWASLGQEPVQAAVNSQQRGDPHPCAQ